jgi:hypothetical protein
MSEAVCKFCGGVVGHLITCPMVCTHAEATARAEKAEEGRRCADADRNREIERREELDAERDRMLRLCKSLLVTVNGVTAYHRHHQRIPKNKLDALCERQIDIEAALAAPDKCEVVVTEREVCRWKWIDGSFDGVPIRGYRKGCDGHIRMIDRSELPKLCDCGLPIVEEKE